MKQNQFSLCLFDIGKVILDFDFRIATKRLAPFCGFPPEEILQRIASWNGLVPFEEGKIAPPEFFEDMRELLNLSVPPDVFLPIWTDIFTENKEVSSLLRRLLGKIPLALISNTNALHFGYCYQTFPIIREVGQFVLSYEVGCRKPDPRIYQTALSRFNTPAQQTIYVDDLEELVRAGKMFGLEAIQFEGAERLQWGLSQRGLL